MVRTKVTALCGVTPWVLDAVPCQDYMASVTDDNMQQWQDDRGTPGTNTGANIFENLLDPDDGGKRVLRN